MKKIGLGTRPSEIKGRDKSVDFDDLQPEEQPAAAGPAARPARRPGRRRKGLLAAGVLLGVIALAGSFAAFDFSFTPALDRVQLVTAGRQIEVTAGDTFRVRYADGLMLKRHIFKGLYRFFPPDGIEAAIDGLPKPADIYSRNIVTLLRPEQQTGYDLVFSKSGRPLGTVSFELDMQAGDWIARAESLEDTAVQKACYQKAIENDPDSAVARVALGKLYEAEKKYKKAIEQFEAAAGAAPKDTRALKALVPLYKRTKQHSRLLETYERLAGADEAGGADYLYDAGRLAEKKGDVSRAIALYRKVLARERSYSNARQRLIKIYEKNKQWKRAAANTRVLLEYEPRNPDLHLYLSDVYLRMNRVAAALSQAEKAEKYGSRSAAVYLQLAMLSERLKKDDSAIKYYTKAVRMDSKNAVACNNLGLLLEKKGRRREAIQQYERAVALDSGKKDFIINLADAYEKNKEWKKAAAAYAKVTRIDKKDRGAWEALAVLQTRAGKTWKALEAYQALAGLEPKKVIWHEKMAILYEKLGKLDKARQEYKTILGLDPKNKTARRKYVEISKQQVKSRLQ